MSLSTGPHDLVFYLDGDVGLELLMSTLREYLFARNRELLLSVEVGDSMLSCLGSPQAASPLSHSDNKVMMHIARIRPAQPLYPLLVLHGAGVLDYVQSLELNFTDDGVDWAAFFALLPKLGQLNFGWRAKHVRVLDLLHALGTRSPADTSGVAAHDGSVRVPMPRVRSLHFYRVPTDNAGRHWERVDRMGEVRSFFAALLGCARARAEAGVPLQRLTFNHSEDIPEADVQELQKCVADVEVNYSQY